MHKLISNVKTELKQRPLSFVNEGIKEKINHTFTLPSTDIKRNTFFFFKLPFPKHDFFYVD